MNEHDFETLRVEHDGAVASVVLNRPDVHDAFDERMIAELCEAFTSLGTDDSARVVLLRSTGRHFCAGADLNWMQRMADYSHEENVADAGKLDAAFRSIAQCPKPVVARVQGAALGGGAGLVAAADIAVASERASLGFTEVRLGILPAVISPYVLRKLAPGTAQALFLTGERFDAQRALQLGLVHRVAAADEVDAAVDEMILALLQCSSEAQVAVKSLVSDVAGKDLEASRAITTRAIADARASGDGREGMAAFLEKRKPAWHPEDA